MKLRNIVVLLGVLITALNLRTVVASVSPIEAFISVDISISPIQLGILGMLAPFAFAMASFSAARIVKLLPHEKLVLVAMFVMVIGNFVRATTPNFILLMIGSLIALYAMGIGNTMLPPITKKYFPRHIGEVTAAYMLMITLSAALPSYISVGMSSVFGWRVVLGLWGLLALIGAIPWIIFNLLKKRRDGSESSSTTAVKAVDVNLFKSKVAWAIAIVAAISSTNFFTVFAWLPQILIQATGMSAAKAGTLLGFYSLIAFPGSILVPIVVARFKKTNLILVIGSLAMIFGYTGLIIWPNFFTWLWVGLIGAGQMIFPVVLVLVNTKTKSVHTSTKLSGFAQGTGYLSAAVAPLLIGVVEDRVGVWQFTPILMLITAVIVLPIIRIISRYESVEDEAKTRSQ